ncbi:3-isopropylmalate dehydrogenase [uncultured Oscillibacter sp.]|uniref:3-isopropylmalate dehydrogenase n=1 Tax=uncultured Oscillibacter sp. TaxID=876091 RepID=UPI0025D77F59|nr:3-isopropylmalate dehydrogenase [uncultured Oscillibacter sp.]
MEKHIALIPGDGIGPEIVRQAAAVLNQVAVKFGHRFFFSEAVVGGCAIDLYGTSLPEQSLQTCLEADSVLLGAVGGPKWDGVPKENRPETALLRLRSAMGVYANLRPVRLFPQLAGASPLRPDIAGRGIDLIVVRELLGGLYFGEHRTQGTEETECARDTMCYSRPEIERIVRKGFEIAQGRRRQIVSVDKSNVLDCSRLWRKIVNEIAAQYPDVSVRHMLVDNCAMQLLRDPSQFDVLLTENMFGDILSDEASMTAGSIGMMPSASLGNGSRGLYEPIHGSAPDLAGQDAANPVGTILSASMMLRYSFSMPREADAVDAAVRAVLDAGFRTGDICEAGTQKVGCSQMGSEICRRI